jgi:nitrate reductase NapAB chaperone NapD
MTKIKEWSVSGLCVTARADRLAEIEEIIGSRSGLEVHARDPKSGKLVVVQERATIEEHRRGLRELQALPGVLTAELVLHYRDPGDQPGPTNPGDRT